MTNEKELIECLKSRYTYDAAKGEIRNRKGQVVKGGLARGYRHTKVCMGNSRCWIYLHHIAWALVYGRFPRQIDHLNGDKTDNRLENLREVNQSENDENRLFTWKRGKGKIPGVYRSRRGYRFHMSKKEYFHTDAHACFHDLSLMGRMYQETASDSPEGELQLALHLKGLSERERRMVCDQLFRYVSYLESVQRMPLLVRFHFFRCVLEVYDFLRKKKQLGRREGAFSEEVALTLVKEMKVIDEVALTSVKEMKK